VCHPSSSGKTHCPHGKPLQCSQIHRGDDPEIGQPLCADCYDYTGHVLFNWHAPELWRRFTIALRCTLTRHLRQIGADKDALRISFVKVAEYQRRAVIHYHTLIRLDPTDNDDNTDGEVHAKVTAIELAAMVCQAANQIRLPVKPDSAATTADAASPESESRILRFGTQIDTQPLTAAGETTKPGLAGRVAAYLAKYTTKSVAEFGIAARRISPAVIGALNIPAHIRRILFTLAELATLPANTAMLSWLHTLGYRGHITTKSRRYSITMTALRAARHHWRIRRTQQPEHDDCQNNPHDSQDWTHTAHELSDWRINGAGHNNDGERLLVHTAAYQARQRRYLARLETANHTGASP
jgi:hypothetical protein